MFSIYILIPLLILGFVLVSQAQNPLKYTYLFRNTILSKSKKYELAPVLRGRIYYPRYFYLPITKQYVVYSDVDKSGPYSTQSTDGHDGKTHALLSESGNIVDTIETSFRFSNRSGSFYGTKQYIPWLETGKSDTVSYNRIYNEGRDFSSHTFEKTFQELYIKADYVEFINLRGIDGDNYDAAVIFRIEGKLEILLSGLNKSHMSRHFQEDEKTNNSEDYYLPDISNRNSFPQSEPAISMVPLETDNTNPFVHFRTPFTRPFRITKYRKTYSSGWNGIMSLHGVPIYVPGEQEGVTCVTFKTKDDIFKIKLVEIPKTALLPYYNLGLRTFHLPAKMMMPHSLVFMESAQNCGSNRLGGGVFVVRTATTDNPSADIPFGITDKRFYSLPLALQNALMDPEHVTKLSIADDAITEWIPEIEYLKNLTELTFSTGITRIPDGIANLPKLEILVMQGRNLTSVSPKLAEIKTLTHLDLDSNPLTEFPNEILELKNLEHLSLNFTRIPSLPAEFSQLKNLTHLDLIDTQVKTLPESMIGMSKLYIYDGGTLEQYLPDTYKPLFDYTKIYSH
jgi:hypothetical protein